MSGMVGREWEGVPVTWKNLRDGLIPWDALDDEELSRGMLRNVNAGFSGGGAEMVPRDLYRHMQSRLAERVQRETLSAVLAAQKVIVDIANDDTVAPAERLRAATHIWDRFAGKVADKVEITAEIKPWENIISGITLDEPEEEHGIDTRDRGDAGSSHRLGSA